MNRFSNYQSPADSLAETAPSLRAARAYLAAQDRRNRLTIREVVRRFEGASVSSTSRHIKALREAGVPATGQTPKGRPKVLTAAEDDAVTAYALILYHGHFPAVQNLLELAINDLRAKRPRPAGPVETSWLRRWLQNHPVLATERARAVELSLRLRKLDSEGTVAWFQAYEHKVDSLNIRPTDLWNVDELGVMISAVRNSQVRTVVLRGLRRTRPEIDNFYNRESATVIAGGSAAGKKIPAYVILKADTTEELLTTEFDPNIRFARSLTGSSNADLILDYLKHFNIYSFKESSTFTSRRVEFQEWFGYDENFINSLGEHIEPNLTLGLRGSTGGQINRLLVLGNFAGNVDIRVAQYAAAFDIYLISLPQKSTHLLQPLDAGAFQLFEEQHQRILREYVKDGALRFNCTDFVRELTKLYDEGLAPHNLHTGFERTGIWPIDPLPKEKTRSRTGDVSGDYILGTAFAIGGFGMVCEATHQSTEKIYACKRLQLAKINITKINQEVALIRKSRHHHVVKVIDEYADNEWYNIILEPRADCNLGAYLQTTERRFHGSSNWQDLQWEDFETKASTLLQWMYCLARAVQHIHRLCIRHRDIKPENILIHGENIILTDFGTSFHCEENTQYATTNTPGTAKYLPVEAAGSQRFGRSGDIFSLGCVFYEISKALLNPLLCAELPSCSGYYSTLVGRSDFWNAIHQARVHPRNKRRLWKHFRFSESLLTIVLQLSEEMLYLEPTCRPTAKEVVNFVTRILKEAHSPTPPCCTPLYNVLDA